MALTADELSALTEDRAVIAAATPGPWVVHNVDDSFCMNAFTVSTAEGSGELDDSRGNVAIVFLQEPRYVDISDGRYVENASFISRARMRWPTVVSLVDRLNEQLRVAEAALAQMRDTSER